MADEMREETQSCTHPKPSDEPWYNDPKYKRYWDHYSKVNNWYKLHVQYKHETGQQMRQDMQSGSSVQWNIWQRQVQDYYHHLAKLYGSYYYWQGMRDAYSQCQEGTSLSYPERNDPNIARHSYPTSVGGVAFKRDGKPKVDKMDQREPLVSNTESDSGFAKRGTANDGGVFKVPHTQKVSRKLRKTVAASLKSQLVNQPSVGSPKRQASRNLSECDTESNEESCSEMSECLSSKCSITSSERSVKGSSGGSTRSHKRRKRSRHKHKKRKHKIVLPEGLQFEMEITDEMVEFFAQSAKHKKERDARDKEEEDEQQRKVLSDSITSNKQTVTCGAPKERPGQRRIEEMKQLYGTGAAMIHGMETAMQLNFDRLCDRMQTKLWPNIPLNVIFD